MAMVLISHDLGVVAENCDRVAVMYAGRIIEEAPSASCSTIRAIPIRAGLDRIAAAASKARAGGSTAIAGTVPDPQAMPQGCAFAPRCARAAEPCGDATATASRRR